MRNTGPGKPNQQPALRVRNEVRTYKDEPLHLRVPLMTAEQMEQEYQIGGYELLGVLGIPQTGDRYMWLDILRSTREESPLESLLEQKNQPGWNASDAIIPSEWANVRTYVHLVPSADRDKVAAFLSRPSTPAPDEHGDPTVATVYPGGGVLVGRNEHRAFAEQIGPDATLASRDVHVQVNRLPDGGVAIADHSMNGTRAIFIG